MRLVGAPGALRDREVEVLGWTTDGEETALVCRLVDGSAGTLPARWTDLPWRVEPEAAVGGVGSPAAWRLLLERGEGLRERRPRRPRASGENGGEDARTARPRDQRGDARPGGNMGDAAAGGQIEVALRLARLLARIVEAERDE